jgi:NSS family neurotransmitter:Na+ symporter
MALNPKVESSRGKWSNPWAFTLATTGSAVGLGNIWKFPYIAGEHGGGAFILVYLVCILLLGLPVMFSEMLIGRRGKSSPAGSLAALSREAGSSSLWKGVGLLAVCTGFLILTFYIVVSGWAFAYIQTAASGSFEGASPQQIDGLYQALLANPIRLASWSAVVIFVTMFIVKSGVEKGIEKASYILMPGLFVILLIMVAYAMTTGHFGEGLKFMFVPDFQKLTVDSVLMALGQAFFSLSLGSGATMVYGSYMPRDISIGKTALWVAGMDTLVALLAGLAIFPLVMAYGLQADSGPGLIFVTLPIAFGQMPFGTFFGTLFFVMLTFATLTSTIALLEPSISWLTEKLQISRFQACAGAGLLVWLLGLGTVFSFNIWADKRIFSRNFFELLDYVTSAWMLPLGSFFVALFCGWVVTRTVTADELRFSARAYGLWRFSIRYVAPVAILMIFLNAIGLNPF